MFWENLKLAVKGMLASKVRTLLSMLGIVIGVASVVAVLTTGASMEQSVTSSLASGGTNLITVFPSRGGNAGAVFTEEYASTLEESFDGIEQVVAACSSVGIVRNGHETMSATITGVPSDYALFTSMEFEEGSFFSSLDNIARRQVCVLGATVAETLFHDGDAIGSFISIFRDQAKSYQVIGVLPGKDAILNISFDSSVFIPYGTYQSRFRKTTMVGSYVVKVKDDADTIAVSNALTDYLDGLVGSDNYGLYSPATMVEMASEVTGTVSAFLAAIAAISLLVGSVGILNIMLVSVVERTREIGIRKALGASPKVILMQFVTESLVLTVTGGIIGSLAGIAAGMFVCHQQNWAFSLSPPALLLAMGVSVLIGVFAGGYPALKAAKLDPIEALQYE